MLLHLPLTNNSIDMRSHTLSSTLIPLMNPPIRQLSILNIPRRILQNAIRLPHVQQFFADGAGGERAFVREAVANGLD